MPYFRIKYDTNWCGCNDSRVIEADSLEEAENDARMWAEDEAQLYSEAEEVEPDELDEWECDDVGIEFVGEIGDD